MAGAALATGSTMLLLLLLSEEADPAEVMELDRRVFSPAGRDTEIASEMAEAVAADASKLAWAVGRSTRKLLMLAGEDIFAVV
jgi:hypothetical protein